MKTARPNDAELVARARNGNRDAFRSIVERYEPVVAQVVIGMLGAGDGADDVGQETFVRLYHGLHKFRGDASLKTYLTRIAINLSLNALKRRKSRAARMVRLSDTTEPALPASDRPLPDRALVRAETKRAVNDAVAELGERQRSVVVLRMLQGCSTKETADLLGIAEGTVMSRLSRAMKTLEGRLGPWMNYDD